MNTTVLQLRMEALAKHLMEAQDPNTWLRNLELSPKPDKNLWLKAVEAIGKEAENLLADLREAMDASQEEISPAEKWSTYFRIQERSHEIFREFLYLLGGLALRDRIHDEFACRFADELISECAEFVGKQTSFSIPAVEDPLSSTLRRVARVNFPDWHLWMLPLVAHEYGQVVVRETNLVRFVSELAQEKSEPVLDDLYTAMASRLEAIDSKDIRTMASAYIEQAREEPRKAAAEMDNLARMLRLNNETATAELAQATAGSIKECLDEARNRAQVLLADAFATFIAGPAYACAALMLRLSPNSPRHPGRPTDEERAKTILDILAEMDANAAPAKPFKGVHKTLESSWNQLVSGSEDGQTARQPEQHLDAGSAIARIRNRVLNRDQAEYTKDHWAKARSLSNRWLEQIENGDPLELPQDINGIRFRDVLNAAWQCRLSLIGKLPPEDAGAATDNVADAARRLCDSILEKRRGLPNPSGFGGRAPRPEEAKAG